MSTEYLTYQNIKRSILVIAWYQISKSSSLETYKQNIFNELKELLDNLNLNHQKLSTLLDEIVIEDKWLRHPKDFDKRINYEYYAMTSEGRKEIDEVFKSSREKLIEWMKTIAPKVAKYFDETVIKPAIQVGIGKTVT